MTLSQNSANTSSLKISELETLETANLNDHKHGDRVLCPCCGFPATLDTLAETIEFEDSCWQYEGDWFCVLMTSK